VSTSLTPSRRSARVALAALVVLMISLAAAGRADAYVQQSGSDGAWCDIRNAGITASSTTVTADFYVRCFGVVDATMTVKRSGVIIYQATYAGQNTWSGLYYNGLPVSFSLYRAKSFGSCTRGAGYQTVVTYTTAHGGFYSAYSRSFSSGAPRAIC
jgi:hypothetical protein